MKSVLKASILWLAILEAVPKCRMKPVLQASVYEHVIHSDYWQHVQ